MEDIKDLWLKFNDYSNKLTIALEGTPSTQLNVIRSWDFDFLVVVLFNSNGAIRQALEVPVDVAKEYGAANKHQNGWVITTSQKFLKDKRSKDITISLSALNK